MVNKQNTPNKILVFDDYIGDFENVCNILIKGKFEVDTSLEKAEKTAIASYKRDTFNKYVLNEIIANQNELAGIIMDFKLTDITSTYTIEFIRKYKSPKEYLEFVCHNIPIIGSSHDTRPSIIEGMVEAGANQFVHKSSIENKLIPVLKEEIQKYNQKRNYFFY